MNVHAYSLITDPDIQPQQRYLACKGMARGYADTLSDDSRLQYARAYCAHVLKAYWLELCCQQQAAVKIKPLPTNVPLPDLIEDVQRLAVETGKLVASFPVEDAGYLIGSIYTVMLPSSIRSELGAFYTPPPLVARLLDLAEEAGFDFANGSAIDPACGGGAFLAPLALRMWQRSQNASPEWLLKRLGKRLKGIEIDPFSAWMTHVLLEAALLPLCVVTKRRLPADLVIVGDALQSSNIGHFDLVVGNPPYGRISLSTELRSVYSRSLYGHANLYGLFTDLALHLAKDGGVISYLTPTSFLAGQYFKALRGLLLEEGAPIAFDFIADREGVFDDVLQETLLTSFRKGGKKQKVSLSELTTLGIHEMEIKSVGDAVVPLDNSPWFLPRKAADVDFVNKLRKMPTRLSDLGYSISTGPLVWNRFKSQLRPHRTQGAFPLIWAESVGVDGFVFRSQRKNHEPYIEIEKHQQYLVSGQSCVLVQRTSAKEQNRRLVSAVLPQSFLDENGGAVIENHLNMIYGSDLLIEISPKAIEVLLNTRVVDRAFRCISGSVSVSAYELNSLPIPTVEQMKELDVLIANNAPKLKIERKVASFYGESV